MTNFFQQTVAAVLIPALLLSGCSTVPHPNTSSGSMETVTERQPTDSVVIETGDGTKLYNSRPLGDQDSIAWDGGTDENGYAHGDGIDNRGDAGGGTSAAIGTYSHGLREGRFLVADIHTKQAYDVVYTGGRLVSRGSVVTMTDEDVEELRDSVRDSFRADGVRARERYRYEQSQGQRSRTSTAKNCGAGAVLALGVVVLAGYGMAKVFGMVGEAIQEGGRIELQNERTATGVGAYKCPACKGKGDIYDPNTSALENWHPKCGTCKGTGWLINGGPYNPSR